MTEKGEAMQHMSNWLVVQTRPRWERKVSHLLLEKGMAVFCPLQEVQRQWSDRVKRIQQPVFPLYVFVKIGQQDRAAVRMIPGVKNFVVKERKLVAIREKTIRTIKLFQKKHSLVQVKAVGEKEPRPGSKNGTLFIEELNLHLVAPTQFHHITESTDNYR